MLIRQAGQDEVCHNPHPPNHLDSHLTPETVSSPQESGNVLPPPPHQRVAMRIPAPQAATRHLLCLLSLQRSHTDRSPRTELHMRARIAHASTHRAAEKGPVAPLVALESLDGQQHLRLGCVMWIRTQVRTLLSGSQAPPVRARPLSCFSRSPPPCTSALPPPKTLNPLTAVTAQAKGDRAFQHESRAASALAVVWAAILLRFLEHSQEHLS